MPSDRIRLRQQAATRLRQVCDSTELCCAPKQDIAVSFVARAEWMASKRHYVEDETACPYQGLRMRENKVSFLNSALRTTDSTMPRHRSS